MFTLNLATQELFLSVEHIETSAGINFKITNYKIIPNFSSTLGYSVIFSPAWFRKKNDVTNLNNLL